MSPTISNINDFRAFFDFLDATPGEYPGHFQFCVPNGRAFDRWPEFPAAARAENGRAAAGRGLTAEACQTGGLGEAIELASLCEWGTEDFIVSTQNELGDQAIGADVLLGLSPDQYKSRDAWNAGPFGGLDWRPRQPDPDRAIRWLPARAATGITRYVPADFVLVGRREQGDLDAEAIATTSGCAAGSSPNDARRRAKHELLERDAIGRWWYGGAPATPIETDLLSQDEALVEFIDSRPRQTALFDISSDLFAYVVVAASWESDGSAVAMGFAAEDDLTAAASSATVELLQTEIGVMQRQRSGDPLTDLWLRKVTCEAPAFRETQSLRAHAQPDSDETTLFIDLTRPAFDIPVMRAICPGLASDKPRFGSKRLTSPRLPLGVPLLI